MVVQDQPQESHHEAYDQELDLDGLFDFVRRDPQEDSNLWNVEAYPPWPASNDAGMEGLRELRNGSAQSVGASSTGQELGHFRGYTSQPQHWPQASDLPLKVPMGLDSARQARESLGMEALQGMPPERYAERWREMGNDSHDSHSPQHMRYSAPEPPGQGPGPPQGSVEPQQKLMQQAYPPAPAHWEDGQCRWHKSAETVGIISEDGHVFTKTAGPRRSRVNNRGSTVELASICMVFDASLRSGGVHRYCYEILDGELGAADGVGFVFDSKVRRNNIQRMRSVFLNQRGRICLRNNQQVTKLEVQLPPLTVGVCLHLLVDLDSLVARFNVGNGQGVIGGSADVSLEGLFDTGLTAGQLRSGFFCAVVTGSITVGLR